MSIATLGHSTGVTLRPAVSKQVLSPPSPLNRSSLLLPLPSLLSPFPLARTHLFFPASKGEGRGKKFLQKRVIYISTYIYIFSILSYKFHYKNFEFLEFLEFKFCDFAIPKNSNQNFPQKFNFYSKTNVIF